MSPLKPNNASDPSIRTFTGRKFYYLNPTPEMVCIEDIAHALALECRFGGHVKEFYSVAQHSVLCAAEAPNTLKLEALMHDAAEAYMKDIMRPLKGMLCTDMVAVRRRVLDSFRWHADYAAELMNELEKLIGNYKTIYARADAAVREKFGLLPVEPAPIKVIDNNMLAAEQRDLIRDSKSDVPNGAFAYTATIYPWSWRESEVLFLREFGTLTHWNRAYIAG